MGLLALRFPGLLLFPFRIFSLDSAVHPLAGDHLLD